MTFKCGKIGGINAGSLDSKIQGRHLERLLGNEHAVKTLSELVQSRTLPHLIFYGPENSGNNAALALARQLYGDTWKQLCIF